MEAFKETKAEQRKRYEADKEKQDKRYGTASEDRSPSVSSIRRLAPALP